MRSKGLLAAIGVCEDGKREVLGFSVADSESETSWSEFFTSLKSRGLTGVDLIVSDNHGGLVAAVKKQFHNASWQRCQTHFSRNVLDKTPKKLQPEIKPCLREIYTVSKIEALGPFGMKCLKVMLSQQQKQWMLWRKALTM